jgi:excisionase family DNA binding protein
MTEWKNYLKSTDVAQLFGVNPSTVALWVKKGMLKPCKTLGRNYRFRRNDIENLWLEKGIPTPSQQKPYEEKRKEERFPFTCPARVLTKKAVRGKNTTALSEISAATVCALSSMIPGTLPVP